MRGDFVTAKVEYEIERGAKVIDPSAFAESGGAISPELCARQKVSPRLDKKKIK